MPNQMEFAHIVMWQTLMILIAIGLWSLWASGKINLIIRPFLSSQIVLVLIWATIGFALWYLFANTYTLFIGRLAWEYFPNNVILSVTDHHFIIVLKNAINNSQSPPIQLLIHNFGFGLVITSAIILGTNKDVEYGEKISHDLDCVQNLCGKTSLSEFLLYFKFLLKKSVSRIIRKTIFRTFIKLFEFSYRNNRFSI